MNGMFVCVQNCFLVEHLVAYIAGIQNFDSFLDNLVVVCVLGLDVLVEVGELVVTVGTRLFQTKVNNSLMSGQVFLFVERFQTVQPLTDEFCGHFDLMGFQLVGVKIVKFLVADFTDFLSTARLEYLVCDPEVLVEVGHLLATLGAGVLLLLVNKLDVTVVVGFLVRLAITVNAGIFVHS